MVTINQTNKYFEYKEKILLYNINVANGSQDKKPYSWYSIIKIMKKF